MLCESYSVTGERLGGRQGGNEEGGAAVMTAGTLLALRLLSLLRSSSSASPLALLFAVLLAAVSKIGIAVMAATGVVVDTVEAAGYDVDCSCAAVAAVDTAYIAAAVAVAVGSIVRCAADSASA